MAQILDELRAGLGPARVLEGEQLREKAYSRWSRIGAPIAIVRPSSTEHVALILKAANKAKQPVVTWGGLTGLVDGACADNAIAISLEHMNRIEAVDPVNATITCQAGSILQAVCETAEQNDLFLPLDLGARGSATIGGTISTNAGGNRVVRWGMMRHLVLGLEAVLADGTVIDSMSGLIKNNAGYDLKQLFIGSEGTLGIVTRAILRLYPLPSSHNTALIAVERFETIPKLLRHVRSRLSGTLSAFEVMWDAMYRLLTTPPARSAPILPHGYPFYILVESMGSDPRTDDSLFKEVLAESLEAGDIADAVVAKSQTERAAMWAIRDDVGQTIRNAPIFAFDVSLKIDEMDGYVQSVTSQLHDRWPNSATLMVFGHLGDGNLHLIAGVGDGSNEAKLRVEEIVYKPLSILGGSISAEHGIGLQKRDFLPLCRTPAEIALMRTLKTALDPNHILNPGKIFTRTGASVETI